MTMLLLAAFQEDYERRGGMLAALLGGGTMLVALVIAVIVFVSFWKIFEKAGKPGWAGLIPIYNLIVLLEIVGRPLWWIILALIPCVNFVIGIILAVDVAKSFGKDMGFAVGLILLPIVFYPILAFGDARYVGPSAAAAVPRA